MAKGKPPGAPQTLGAVLQAQKVIAVEPNVRAKLAPTV